MTCQLYNCSHDTSQPFWGDIVTAAGAGPSPIPWKSLNSENLSQAIRFCFMRDVLMAAKSVARSMSQESGVQAVAASFHRNLPQSKMRCDLLPNLPAVWVHTKSRRSVKLSGAAAEILLRSHKIKSNELKL